MIVANMRPFDLVLFDLDGTLTDSQLGITRSAQHALAHFGVTIADPAELTSFVGPPLHETFSRAFGLSEEDAFTAIEVYRDRYGRIGYLENEVYPGIPELLCALADAGITLAVASSKAELYVERILEHFGLHAHFTVIGGSNLDHSRTDKGEVIAHVLAQLPPGFTRERTVMVGDREHDIFGARSHGIATISVRHGYAPDGELAAANPLAIAESVAELAALLGVPASAA